MADSTQQIKEITAKLEQGVKDLFASDKYADYLKTMSRFHKYSTRNTLLIHLQKPDSSFVAGFTAWKKKFGRHVKRNEKAIKILAPTPFVVREEKEKLDPNTRLPVLDENGMPIIEEIEHRLARFKAISVYDISQTDGKPLPTLVQDLTGNVEQYMAFVNALRAVSPLPIVIEYLSDNTDGLCHYGEKILIREGMSEIQTVCAIIHELVHSRLHDLSLKITDDENTIPKDRRTEEVEAESITFTVLNYFNLDTGDNSFGYIAEWSKNRELKELNASLDVIRKTSAELIDEIDCKFQEIAKERDINLSIKEEQDEMAELDMEIENNDENKKVNIMTTEQKLYEKFAELFPQVANGEYSYLRLEAGAGMEPLSLEWIDDDKISIMHTYTMNGDLMYDPMIAFEIDKSAKTLTAVEYQHSYPPLYQRIDEDGVGLSVDGNGKERIINDLQRQLNDFMEQWFNNIEQQDYIPIKANIIINGEETQITFDNDGNPIIPKPEKVYDLSYGFLGNGVTVWNRAEEHDGDYMTVAHIERDRSIKFYDKDMPEEVKESIRKSTWIMEDDALNPLPAIETDLIMPDTSIGYSEMNLYGYMSDELLPLTQNRAVELFDDDHTIYLLYPDNTEVMVFVRDEIMQHDGLYGIERVEWEVILDFEEMKTLVRNSGGNKEADLLYGGGNRFGIYQIHHDIDESRNFRFASVREMEAHGLSIDRANYELIYTAPFSKRIELLTDKDSILDQIYEDFNINHPADFKGHSLSVSDVIVLKYNGDVSSHYVDRIGFVEIPAFLGEETPPTTVVENPIQNKETEKNVKLPDKIQSGVSKSKPTLMNRLEENKFKAAQHGQNETNKIKEREV